MKCLFLPLVLAMTLCFPAPFSDSSWFGNAAWADGEGEGEGGDGDGGDGDGGDGDGGDGDGGDSDGGDSDGGDSDSDGPDRDGDGPSASSGGGRSGGGGENRGVAPITAILDLFIDRNRTTVPEEIIVLTPKGVAEPSLIDLQGGGFTLLEDVSLGGLQARFLRLSTPPGVDLEQALETVRQFAPGSTVDLNDLYDLSGIGCDGACWGADLMSLQPIGIPSCRDGAPIAMIDTGVSLDHPSLRNARIETKSFLRDGAVPAPREHGTAIAALLVGTTAPEAIPLAREAYLLAAEAIGLVDDEERADAFALVQALDWSLSVGARVIALSLAGGDNAPLQFAIQQAAQRAHIVAAAGNGGINGLPAYPAAYPEVIAVSAVDARLRPYRGGNRGTYVELSAPGVNIPSASVTNGTDVFTGTSFAVPFAVAAIMRASAEMNGDIAAARRLLQRRAQDLGELGRDEVYGFGLIQSPGQKCW